MTKYSEERVQNMRLARWGDISITERFWSKVDKNGPNGCWIWTGYVGSTGYGNFRYRGKRIPAHRVAYELVIGPIPEGLSLDHLCRNRACVNPYHLEPVTLKENILRGESISAKNAQKTHCPKGHPLEGDNLLKAQLERGQRGCRFCHNEQRRWRSRK